MHPGCSIYVAGAETLAGAAIRRSLAARGFSSVLGADGRAPDPTDAAAVEAFFAENRPDYVFVTAGRSGGILANQRYPADLMLDNLRVASAVLPAAFRHGARGLLYLASSCSYPRLAPQPLRVESLMTGPLEPTNEAYAVSKLAGITLCAAYRQQHGARFFAALPANPFGLGDDFSEEDSHVIGALIRRLDRARREGAPRVDVWGTGAARREFLFSEDLGDACVSLLDNYRDDGPVNSGGGETVSTREQAQAVRQVVGYPGEIHFDATRPDGMPVKMLDSTPLLELGWQPRTDLQTALAATYREYLGACAENGAA